ncbi:MAG TPA: NHL repeat-containing protein [Thermoanaerobaculia bacterium]|nr:NHL repeat-containing protein [Thermoanaerobaculia bacterium]
MMVSSRIDPAKRSVRSAWTGGRVVLGCLAAIFLVTLFGSCRKKEAATEAGSAPTTSAKTSGQSATETITPKPGPPQSAQVTLKIGTSSGLRDPHGIAVDGRGNIYIVDTGNTRIVKFDPTGRELVAFGKKGPGPGQFLKPSVVAISPQGNVVVLDSETSWIQVFAPDGKFLNRMAGPEMSLYHPAGLAVSSDGTMAIADTGGNRIVLIDSDGKLKGSPITGVEKQPFSQPTDVYFDAQGGIHVYQTAGPKAPSMLFHLTSTGQPAGKWIAADASSTIDTPRFALASDGRVYASDPHQQQLRVYDANGAQYHLINMVGNEAAPLKLVAGIAVDRQGRVYVLDARAGVVYRT